MTGVGANLSGMNELWLSCPGGWDASAKVRVSRLADRQFGRVRASQLRRLGVGTTTLARWTKEAFLHRVLPTVYAVGHQAPTVEGDLAAALLYAGPGAMLSHATAAWWFELIDRRPRTIDVSTRRRCVSVRNVRVHDRRALDRSWHQRFPVTPVPHLLLDLAASSSIDRLRYALAEAEYRGLLDLRAVAAVLGRGRRGSGALRQALQRHQPRFAYTRSQLERAFIGLCERYEIPLPQVNVFLAGWLVDAAWPEQRLVVELDGYPGHRTRAQIERDHERDLQLRAAGFVVVRYTWEQITTRPQLVVADLQRALGIG